MARTIRNDSQPVAGPGPSTQIQRDLEIIGDGPVDEAGRAALRDELRNYQQQAQELAENPNIHSLVPLVQSMKANDQLFGKVKRTTEAAIDAKTIMLNSSTAQKISKLAKNEANAFDIDEILGPLRRKLGMHLAPDEDVEMDDEDAVANMRRGRLGDWAAVGWMAAKHSRRVFGVEFMYGPMAIEPKQRRVGQRRRANQGPSGPMVQPAAVAQEDLRQNENETVKNVRKLEILLEQQSNHHPSATELGVPFFEWFINPDDYGQSVENLFYTSFLVRDGKCSIAVDEDSGDLHIMSCEPPDQDDYEAGLTKLQVIMELTEDSWREAIKLYNIKRSIIPTRERHVQVRPTRGGWY